ncbi:hypothetical protein BABINDRAFT_40353, partial [Babjeviella inositovora NRRL Y-12698]
MVEAASTPSLPSAAGAAITTAIAPVSVQTPVSANPMVEAASTSSLPSAAGVTAIITAIAPVPIPASVTSAAPSATPSFSAIALAALAITTTVATMDSYFADTILAATNAKRVLHGVDPLVWNDTLAVYANNYATSTYQCNGILKHSGGQYGENLAAGYSTVGAVEAWYDEIQYYNFSNPGYSSNTGHFTQLIWKSSAQLGCAYINCTGAWGQYIICEYNPHGNVIGWFPQNVFPLL